MGRDPSVHLGRVMRWTALFLSVACSHLAAADDYLYRDGIRERESRIVLRQAPPTRIEPDMGITRGLMPPPRVRLETPRLAPPGPEPRVHLGGGHMTLAGVMDVVAVAVGYSPVFVHQPDSDRAATIPELQQMSLSGALALISSIYDVRIIEFPESRLLMVTPNVDTGT